MSQHLAVLKHTDPTLAIFIRISVYSDDYDRHLLLNFRRSILIVGYLTGTFYQLRQMHAHYLVLSYDNGQLDGAG